MGQQGVRGIEGVSLAGKDSSIAESSNFSRCCSHACWAADLPASVFGGIEGAVRALLVMLFFSTLQAGL
jgi:hypothetical protein